MCDYELIFIAFMLTSVIVSISGVIGCVLAARYISRGAERIGRDISRGMASRIEREIRRDIDSGEFYY